jgi:hypothetical protein
MDLRTTEDLSLGSAFFAIVVMYLELCRGTGPHYFTSEYLRMKAKLVRTDPVRAQHCTEADWT